jgi:hypothetical protein
MRTGGGRARDGSAAMLKQRILRVGSSRNRKAFRLLGIERFGFEERDYLIENRGVASGADVVRSNKGEPEKIVGDSRTDAGARLWVPPVLNIAFHELPCGRAQDVVASQVWRGVYECHDILQLISEPVSAA